MSKNFYDFFSIQNKFVEIWEKNKIFQLSNNSKKELFSIDTPPPTVSGTLHIGHIFSYTHTDFIARYKRLDGYEIFYPFGFDNNGLPTERYVEKESGKVSHSMSRNEFIDLCLDFTEKAQFKFIDLWKKIGLSIDWRFCYSTISKEVQKISQQNFIELYKKGFIYKKSEPALFCTAFKTSVSQAELEEVEKETFFTTISFKVEESNEEVLISTTRPELLASCCAIFFHPDDIRYKNLKNKKVVVPLYDFLVEILPDDKVIPEKGTGLVMCCTFGDSLDVYWYKKHNFKYLQSIGIDGKMTERTIFLEGLSVFQGREKILQKLKDENFIKKQEKIKHTVSIYERSKKEIEYLVLSQWFVSLIDYKEEFLKSAENINWIPDHMKQRYINWVENLKWDWCISRQRFYGIPFPVWYDKDGNVILAEEDDLPIDPIINKPKNIDFEIFPDTDVMDTWNTSSLTPLICKKLYEKYVSKNSDNFFPMSVRPQAHDIIRTWAFDTIVKSWMNEENIPWKNILISGHVLSKDKEKISKSKDNNPMDPDNLLSNYSVDSIRYWTASAKLGIDTAFSEDQLKLGNKLLVKLFNAAKFLEINISNECLNLEINDENFNPKLKINIWVLEELKNVFIEYKKYFDKYDFSTSLNEIERFFWSIFCDNYLEIIKDIFFKPFLYSEEEINEIKKTLAKVFKFILQLFSPFLIYLTENIYQDLFRKNSKDFISIHNLNLNDSFDFLFKEKDFKIDNFYIFLKIISEIRRLKSDENISLKTEISNLKIILNKDEEIFDENLKKLLCGICCAKKLEFLDFNNEILLSKIYKNDLNYEIIIKL